VWVTNCALELRLHPSLGQPRATFRKFNVAWPDLIDMEFHDDAVVIHSKSGRRLIPLGRYGNAIEIRDALRETFAQRAPPGAT
jgi:hypothetical protein